MKCDAVVLAAGKGTRMWPFTETIAKPAIPILDRPLIHYVLDYLTRQGVRKVCVVVNYRAEDVKRAVGEYGIHAKYVVQDEPKGTGHALLVAEKYVGDDFFVVNGDVLLTNAPDLPSRSILVVDRPHNGEFGTAIVDNGVLVDLREKEPGRLINGGVYHLGEDAFTHLYDLQPSPRGEYEITDILPKLGLRAVVASESAWMDVGRPWDLVRASARVLSSLPGRRDGSVEPRATLKGKVIVSEDAEVRNGAYVVGPAYIGPGAVVGPNAYVRSYS
ncbi:MAG: NTP transferase domain-containing protein, partial [Candidatus Diapherotrites archaeon]|nr:NTP transferase domain-containing protein [Candidatus Diapherotrites archaeon]